MAADTGMAYGLFRPVEMADDVRYAIERSSSADVAGRSPSNVHPTADGDAILIATYQDTVFDRLAVTPPE